MKIIGGFSRSLDQLADEARELEDIGIDIGATAELTHDPLLQLALAATKTERIQLMTSIAVAFARSPMTVA